MRFSAFFCKRKRKPSLTQFLGLVISSLLVFSLTAVGFQNRAYSQSSQGSNLVIIKNVEVDEDLAPNRPFEIRATVVSTRSTVEAHLGIKVPDDISVSGASLVNLGSLSNGKEKEVSWELSSNRPGSFEVTLIAYASDENTGQASTTEFNVNLSIGTTRGLTLTELHVPGALTPNTPFEVGIMLKNNAGFDAENVIAQITLPTGINSLDASSSAYPIIKAGEEISLNWTMVASGPGSYEIAISFGSSNAGSSTIPSTLSVGITPTPEIRPLSWFFGDSEEEQMTLRPGDKNIPLHIRLVNTGNIRLFNLTSTLDLTEPFFWAYREGGLTIQSPDQVFDIVQIGDTNSVEALYYISVRPDVEPAVYSQQLSLSYSDGTNELRRIFDLPIVVASSSAVSLSAVNGKVFPGQVSDLSVDVKNIGNVAIHSLTISSSGDTFRLLDSPIWVGDLAIGEVKTVNMKVLAPIEAADSPPLDLLVTYESPEGRLDATHQIGIEYEGTPTLGVKSVTVDPADVFPGDRAVQVDVEIINSGYVVARNVTATLSVADNFTASWGNSDYTYIGNILPNESATISFFVDVDRDVEPSIYRPSVMLQGSNWSDKIDFNFVISEKARFEIVSMDDSELYPGASNVAMKIGLRNTGSFAAEGVTTQFIGGNILPGVVSSMATFVGNEENLGDVEPGQIVTTTFIVNVDPAFAAGEHVSSLEIMWEQNGEAFKQTLPVKYDVSSGPGFLLYSNGIPWTYVILAGAIAAGVVIFMYLRNKRVSKLDRVLGEDPRPRLRHDEGE